MYLFLLKQNCKNYGLYAIVFGRAHQTLFELNKKSDEMFC